VLADSTAPGTLVIRPGVAVDAQGQVFVSDSGNGRVLVFTVP